MRDLLQFAVLGVGAGAIYALAAQGAVLIYRGSGVLNFAHGAVVLVGAHLFAVTYQDRGWPVGAALALVIAVTAVIGLLVQVLVMHPLRHASPLARLIATVGLLAFLQQAVILQMDVNGRTITPFLPDGMTSIGGVRVGHDRIALVLLAIGITATLSIAFRRSRFGIATRAVAENRRAVATLGYSPSTIAATNWVIGCGLAGLAGALIVPISGLSPTSLTLIVVPAFAAALIGRFTSFGLTLLGALGIGIGQSVITKYVESPGWADALPFLAIVVMLAWRGTAVPTRDELIERLPRVGRRPASPIVIVPFAVVGALLLAGPERWVGTITATLLAAIIALSLVAITGLAGQVSFAQYTLAGVGALVAGRLSEAAPWASTPVAWVVGIVAAVAVGLVFAVPSLRTRGVSLAIVTLGLSLAVEKVVFANKDYTGGYTGTNVRAPSLFGWDISPLRHPDRYALVVTAALLVVTWLVLNLRAGAAGRRLLAIRSNERAASALGINVAGVKFFAFAVSASIAALGGVLMGFRFQTIQYSEFTVFSSLNLLVFVVLGGIGYLAGGLLGALLVPGALVAYLLDGLGDSARWITMLSGAAVTVNLVMYPDGIAHAAARARSLLPRRRAHPRPELALERRTVERVAPATLEIVDLSVRYGEVAALDRVSLAVQPGRITGLIGANGAGKTTLLDAVSGFTSATGRVVLDGVDLSRWPAHRRARAGLARTFQSVELFADLSVRESLLTATDHSRLVGLMAGILWPARDRLPPAAQAAALSLGLEDVLDQPPDALSYGARRLQGVAQAVATRPSILLLDEPAAGLDEAESRELARVLRALADDLGIGVLLIEHHVRLVLDVSDHVVALDFGRTIFDGSPDAAASDPAIRAAYLGTETEDGDGEDGTDAQRASNGAAPLKEALR